MKTKKKIYAILLCSVITLCLLLGLSACGKSVDEDRSGNEPPDSYINGAFYTLQEAYDNGFLSSDDLLSIAYYHHSQSRYPNNGVAFNVGLMGENYVPAEKSPSELRAEQNCAIRQTLINNLKKFSSSNSFALDDIVICAYYGTYNEGIAVRLLYKDGGDIILQDVMYEDTVANIKFVYSEYTEFFRTVDYNFNNTILIWKKI